VWLNLTGSKIQALFHHQGFTLMGINANDATQYPGGSFDNMKPLRFGGGSTSYLCGSTQDVTQVSVRTKHRMCSW